MNLLQSFMGCMYPDIIRTESIESMEHDCRFQAANIDERGNEISRGELQITNDDLIYFKPSKFPTRWPLNYIRRYGCIDESQKFVFEVGRKCSTGQAIFAFRLSRGNELAEKLNEKIESKLLASQNENTTTAAASLAGSCYIQRNPCAILQRKKDAGTSNDCRHMAGLTTSDQAVDPRPLSYALIDFETTKALNDSAQAHAATRAR